VLLVDDHTAFRQPLAYILAREAAFEVVEAKSVAEALPLLPGIDVAVVDLDLPDGSGLEVIRALRATATAAASLVLTAGGSERDRAAAVEAGAAGILHKTASIAEIVEGIRRAAAGEHLLSPREMIELLRFASQQRERDLARHRALGQITPRERAVLQALANGLTDKEIGQQLRISADTVRTHMGNILGKLGLESRLQALIFAVQHGLVTLDAR
jgi:DNA-binding NarL/FixJ family response regulator